MRFGPSALAARLGLEPRQNESESFVLPLHHQAVDAPSAANITDTLPCGAWERAGSVVLGGAGDGIRTRNRLFTKQVLYR